MSGTQLFATFGLPAIAISASLLVLWAGQRSTARFDAEQARAARNAARR